MSVTPHSFVDYTSDNPRTAIKAKTSTSKRLTRQSNLENKNLTRLDNGKVAKIRIHDQQLPIWLRSLLVLENGSKVCAFCVIAGSLILYGLTVNVPKRWTEEYNKLITLERREREFIEKNEAIKNQLATEAQQDSAMISLDPTKAIFLETAPTKIVVLTSTTSTSPQAINHFLGY